MNPERPEMARPKFTLQRENIFPQDRLPVPELLSQQLADMGWPLELQGTGSTDYEHRELKIHYPLGDIFLSFATTIHEIGHWRQSEVDSILRKRPSFLPEKEISNIHENEKDAWQRGWERLEAYAPHVLADLEARFARYKKSGQLAEFEGFSQLCDWIETVSLQISYIIQNAQDIAEEAQRNKKICATFKLQGVDKTFYEIAGSRVGEKVDPQEMEAFLMTIAEGTANEVGTNKLSN